MESLQGMDRPSADALLGIIELQNVITRGGFDRDSVLQAAVERAGRLIGAAGAAIELVDGPAMTYRAACGIASHLIGTRVGRDDSPGGRCVAEGRVVRWDDTPAESGPAAEIFRRIGAASVVSVPIASERGVLGVLEIFAAGARAFGDP